MRRVILASLGLCALSISLLRCSGEDATVTTQSAAYLGAYDLETNPHPLATSNPHVSRAYVFDGDTAVQPSLLSARVAAATAASSVGSDWLSTKKNHIYRADGSLFMARGANVFDTRQCDLCTYSSPNNADVLRRIDTLVDTWGGNLIRFNLESYANQNYRTQWQGVLDDASYFADVVATVQYVRDHKPGTYIMLTLFEDPSFDSHNIPSAATATTWTKLASTFLSYPNVIFAIANEPHAGSNDSQAQISGQGAEVWSAMTLSVNAIRKVEDAAKSPHHLIAVQGTTGWSRNVQYYINHPIKSDNIIYEVHPYDTYQKFVDELVTPAKTLPLIVGEFGLVTEFKNSMGLTDAVRMMDICEGSSIPYIGWAMTSSCGIPLLQKTSKDSCGVGSNLVPTSWGRLLIARLQSMQSRAPGAPSPLLGTLATVVDTDLCLFDSGYGTSNTVAATLNTCDFSNPASSWRINSNKTLSVGANKRCLQRASNNIGVQVAPCNGTSLQKFSANGGLFQTDNNKCLYVPNTVLGNGSALRLGGCNNISKGFWQMF